MSDQNLIWDSLEIVAKRCDDLIPLVYARFFAERPEILEIFSASSSRSPNPAMGNMINELITLIADGIDAGALDATMMSTLINHIGWEIDLGLYQSLLNILIDVVQSICGDDWTTAMAAEWQRRAEMVMDSLRRNLNIIEGQRHQK